MSDSPVDHFGDSASSPQRPFAADSIDLQDSSFSFSGRAKELAHARRREVAAESGLRLLNQLGDAARTVEPPHELLATTLRMLGQHLQVSRCIYAEPDAETGVWTILPDYVDSCPSLAGRGVISQFGSRLTLSSQGGVRPVVVRDVSTEISRVDGAESFQEMGIRALICCTLVRDGVCCGIMAVHSSVPRDWTESEIALVQAFVERSWAAVEQTLVEAKLRTNEVKLDLATKAALVGGLSGELEAVGQLASGIAHDFNNLLSVILTYAYLLDEGLKVADPLRKDVDEIRKAGERASELTVQLLAFSRQQVPQPRVVTMNQITRGLTKPICKLVGDPILVSVLPSHIAGKVLADPQQIEQVIMSLVANARDAMPGGGRLSIETSNVDLREGDVSPKPALPRGRYVVVSIIDSGIGMTPAIQSHIFEPFFTTKAAGNSSGLGLSTVFGIVTQSGGHIEVSSELGAGSTFRIFFPRVDCTLDEMAQAAEPVRLRGVETLLLVEDDEQVRALMHSVLRRAGYNVLVAQNGGEAFLICERHPTAIQLLLTDVVLPRMSGRELAQRLYRIRPDMKVLYTSGYTEDAIIRNGVLATGIAFLPKPITPLSLLQKVQEVLQDIAI